MTSSRGRDAPSSLSGKQAKEKDHSDDALFFTLHVDTKPEPTHPQNPAAITAWLRPSFFFSETTPLCLPMAWCMLVLYRVCGAQLHFEPGRVSTMSRPVMAFGLRIRQQKAKEACSNRPNRQSGRANHASSSPTTTTLRPGKGGVDAVTRMSVRFPHVVLILTTLSSICPHGSLRPFSRRSSVTMMEKLTLAVVSLCVLRMSLLLYLYFLALSHCTRHLKTEGAVLSPSPLMTLTLPPSLPSMTLTLPPSLPPLSSLSLPFLLSPI